MNTEWAWLSIALGLTLRLGVPLLALVVMVWLVRRLDARWQAEAKQPPLTSVAPDTHCWELHDCPPDRRAACLVTQHPDTPCWQQHRDSAGNLSESCLACELFAAVPATQTAPQPAHEEHHV